MLSILLIVFSVGFTLSLIFLFYFIQKNPTQGSLATPTIPIENYIPLPIQKEITSGLPIRLKIPKINIDTAIEYVGLTPDGAMDMPKGSDNAAWFSLGQRPGEIGNAIIAGHYGWKNKKPSVFDNLYKLQVGDKIYIEDDKGTTISFVVRESRRYNPETNASNVFSSDDGKSHLNLITCEGNWDETLETYSKRLVVFTDKE